jgi:hypothetical protein
MWPGSTAMSSGRDSTQRWRSCDRSTAALPWRPATSNKLASLASCPLRGLASRPELPSSSASPSRTGVRVGTARSSHRPGCHRQGDTGQDSNVCSSAGRHCQTAFAQVRGAEGVVSSSQFVVARAVLSVSSPPSDTRFKIIRRAGIVSPGEACDLRSLRRPRPFRRVLQRRP